MVHDLLSNPVERVFDKDENSANNLAHVRQELHDWQMQSFHSRNQFGHLIGLIPWFRVAMTHSHSSTASMV